MEKEEILTKLERIFKNVFDDQALAIGEDTSPADLANWDSLHQVLLISAIQDEFKVVYKPKEVKALRNVRLIVSSIMEKACKNVTNEMEIGGGQNVGQ